MAASQYTTDLKIGDVEVNNVSVLYFRYTVLWDRGTRVEILIIDSDYAIHDALSGVSGDPSIPITFKLTYQSSEGQAYDNRGSEKKLYVRRMGVVSTPNGPGLRVIGCDAATLFMRRTTGPFSANAKVSDFLTQYLQQAGVQAQLPGTGDAPHPHRANHGTPLEVIRYELDRVLTSGGKPISIQYNDNADAQQLVGYEELYEGSTGLVTSWAEGVYEYGQSLPDNQAKGAGWGVTIYDYDFDMDVANAMWGHKVSVDQLTSNHSVVQGEVEQKLGGNLGIQPTTLDQSHRRDVTARTYYDNPNQDEYFQRCSMVNSVFQSEMSMTQGFIIIDPDYAAFDSVDILNRKHLIMSITGGRNLKSGDAIIPNEAVIMGWQHVIGRDSAGTKVLLRRGK